MTFVYARPGIIQLLQTMSATEETPPPPGRLAALRLAFAFLTRLPVGTPAAYGPAALAAAAWAFPLVGVGVGLIAAAAFAAASWAGLTLNLAALAAVAASIWTTRALHEDGLADIADGFGGGHDRTRKLAIMRDSRVGSFAVLALGVSLFARVGAIAALDHPAYVVPALVGAGAASRAAMVALMYWMKPARDEGLGHHAGRPTATMLVLALVIAAAAAELGLGLRSGLYGLVGAAVGAVTIAWLARRNIGGQTGDVLGAAQQAAEIGFLLAIVIADPMCLNCTDMAG